MRIELRATGVDTGALLSRLHVDLQTGAYTYESHAVEEARGQLSDGDTAQLRRLFEGVDWGAEVLNSPIDFDDSTRFEMEVWWEDTHRTYLFSESLETRSWQFRDLVHFLRHNVATAGEPVGIDPPPENDRPPAEQR